MRLVLLLEVDLDDDLTGEDLEQVQDSVQEAFIMPDMEEAMMNALPSDVEDITIHDTRELRTKRATWWNLAKLDPRKEGWR